jgi:hypothetical protein
MCSKAPVAHRLGWLGTRMPHCTNAAQRLRQQFQNLLNSPSHTFLSNDNTMVTCPPNSIKCFKEGVISVSATFTDQYPEAWNKAWSESKDGGVCDISDSSICTKGVTGLPTQGALKCVHGKV